jgi:hypothetical protein
MSDDWRRARPRDVLASLAQVFGTVFAVILAAVTAASWAGTAAAVLTTTAALAACIAIFTGFNHRPWDRRKKILVSASGGIALGLIAAAVAVGVAGRQSTAGVDADTGSGAAESKPAISSPNYRLTPSSSIFTNDQDKVDLDTACPGHGPTKPQVGPDRCGENADLILDAGELLTWERSPRMALLPAGTRASQTTCRKQITQGDMVGSVEVEALKSDSELCVKTDKGSVAVVRIEDLTKLPSIAISFDVWPPGA